MTLFLDSLEEKNRYLAVRWECVFLPDNGATFLNDMVMNATIFNAWILLRGTHLLTHLAALCTSRSWAEVRAKTKEVGSVGSTI